MLIEYLNHGNLDKDRVVLEALEARLLPFALARHLSPDDPVLQDCVVDCIGKLEGFKQALIARFGVSFPQSLPPSSASAVSAPIAIAPVRERVQVSEEKQQEREELTNIFS